MDADVRERFERIENILASLASVATLHDERLNRIEGIVDGLAVSHAETQEELGTLIRMMDEWIRNNPNSGRKPS